ncbi:hypothetical protein C7402_123107 [Paraburkholderia unamae]|uniref:Uncharacterized protein n=1 Tax=Paraburkholderia unamae TaxID=219649 RepID=A0ABX5KBF6_9BURK|nr:hypothetical protein C7402_123107 [Paraburkholderia unamae]RAR54177.1 hypothetical protein C7401_1258 [Paraburkholderia unamae]
MTPPILWMTGRLANHALRIMICVRVQMPTPFVVCGRNRLHPGHSGLSIINATRLR